MAVSPWAEAGPVKFSPTISVYDLRDFSARVGRLFRHEKMDTMDIARVLKCTEADAYNALIMWRQMRRLEV